MLFNVECPSCRRQGMTVNFHNHDVEYFGEVMESVLQCVCGYRHADVVVLGEQEPVRLRIKIRDEEDLNIRVVRSGKSTIEIPELGVKVTPGVASDGYISNVEGVLARIEDVVSSIKGWGGGKKVDELLERLGRVRRGEESVHLIIEDPSGNSAIISGRAEKEVLG